MGLFDEEQHKTEQLLIKKAKVLSKRKDRIFYMNAAILSVYGWQMAIPVLLGIILGHFLDKHVPISHFSWILNLIIIGFAIGWINASRWVRKEGVIKKKKTKGKRKS